MVEVRPAHDSDEFARGDLRDRPVLRRDRRPRSELERFSKMLPLERMHAAFDDGEIVGGAGAFTFELSVPGGAAVRRRHGRRRLADAPPARRPARDDAPRSSTTCTSAASRSRRSGRGGADLRPLRLRDRRVVRRDRRSPRAGRAFAQPFERRGQTRLVDAGGSSRRSSRRSGTPSCAAAPGRLRAHARSGGSSGACGCRRRRRRARSASSRSSSTARSRHTRSTALASSRKARRRPGSKCGGDRRDAAGDGGDLALPARHRLVRRRRVRAAAARPSALPAAREAAAHAVPHGRRRSGCGSSTSARRSRAAQYAGDGGVVFDVRDAVCPWNEARWKLVGGSAARTTTRRISRSTSPRSARPTSAACRSRNSGTASASRSSPRARSSAPTRSSRGARRPGALRSSSRARMSMRVVRVEHEGVPRACRVGP